MLRELRVTSFAIIDDLRLSFSQGFNVLTGETGAGKSILVDALGLALGDKARPEQIRSGAAEARVEAVFQVPPELAGRLKSESGLDIGDDGQLCVQRRVAAGGRSVSYLNGSAVTLNLLADVCASFVDILGQHHHQTLLRTENHLDILDDYGGLGAARQAYLDIFAAHRDVAAQIARADAERRDRAGRLDYLSFQLREIEAAGLSPGEDAELEKKRAIMQNAEKISLLADEALAMLYDGDPAAQGLLESAAGRLGALAAIIPEAVETGARLREAVPAVAAAVECLQDWRRRAEYDAEEHNRLEERLAALARLKRKYGGTVDDILARAAEMRADLDRLRGGEEAEADLARRLDALAKELAAAGGLLSGKRAGAAARLEKAVMANLNELAMNKARFAVRWLRRESAGGAPAHDGVPCLPGERGLEEAEFMLSANVGEDLKSLSRIASGGELSRIMLAVKTCMAMVDRVPTLIFDEIDAGISGAVARIVGRKLKKLSGERQVICVTHLPQIASLAETHFKVEKKVIGGRTLARVASLEGEKKVAEIARLLAGEKITEAARHHARELMEAS